MASDNNLSNKTILVTRPEGLHIKLCERLTNAGATAIHHAAIEITEPSDNSSRIQARNNFSRFDIAIFISPTAVNTTLAFMEIDDSNCALAAIGSRSQQALEQAGLTVSIQPQGHDSESLLQHPLLQADCVSGKHIVIFRGEDGRDVLANELRKRHALVVYVAAYARRKPQHSRQLNTAFVESLHAITISSNEGLQNIAEMVSHAGTNLNTLTKVKLFVPGMRAYTLAKKIGFKHIIVADNATDDAMLKALLRHL